MTDETKQKINVVLQSRLPRQESKAYYMYWLNLYAQQFDPEKVKSVHFGKQDIRGGNSISLYFTNHCMTGLRYFNSMKELIEYVIGFMHGQREDHFDKKYFMKVEK